MSQATESLFAENHEHFFNSIGQKRQRQLARPSASCPLCPRGFNRSTQHLL